MLLCQASVGGDVVCGGLEQFVDVGVGGDSSGLPD